VAAAGITFAELTWDLSWTTRDGADRTPVIPSHEMSGTIAEVGLSVSGLGVGDEVVGLLPFDRDGAAAEFVAAPSRVLASRPRMVTHVEAAAVPLAALTAWQALVEHAAVQSGERVLVHGGAGGVGVYAVQLAAARGADVTATATGDDAAFVETLGASRVIDFRNEAFDEVVSGLDAVLDTVGGSTLDRSYDVLRQGGRLVTLGGPPSPDRARSAGVDALFFVVRPDRDQLTHLAAMVDDGSLRPVVAQTFPLSAGRAAFESETAIRQPGKTVLIVSDGRDESL
jgi:NADPH:quinone reductase-like Zn-dependent oxidoreductase